MSLYKQKIILLIVILCLVGCSSKRNSNKVYSTNNGASQIATMRPYQINGITYYPQNVEVGYIQNGVASWYGPGFHGKKTSNGETYNQHSLTAAHTTLPMNTIVRVKNLENNKVVTVRVNDRGPFAKNRIIDLSNAAAKQIDMTQKGTANVRLEVLEVDAIHNLNANDSYLVQIGSFSDFNNAQAYKDEHHNKYGYSSKVKPNSNVHRVYLHGFKDEKSARDFVDKGFYQSALVIVEKE